MPYDVAITTFFEIHCVVLSPIVAIFPVSKDLVLSQHVQSIPVRRLNAFYNFKESFLNARLCPLYSVQKGDHFLSFHLSISELVQSFLYFRIKDLINIAHIHGLQISSNMTLSSIRVQLIEHSCNGSCQKNVYIFQARPKERVNIDAHFVQNKVQLPVPRTISSLPNYQTFNNIFSVSDLQHTNETIINTGVQTDLQYEDHSDSDSEPIYDYDFDTLSDNAHLKIADMELKRSIIKEWQEVMATHNVKRIVCAICGKKTLPSDVLQIRASKRILALLCNNELPSHVYPRTYNFEAYHKALLHPLGLRNLETPGKMNACKYCEHKVVKEGVMPKFALANWLYYGEDCLPENVRQSFKDATPFEQMLVSRARANKICFKFSEIRAKEKNTVIPASDHAVSQKRMSGNVMIMPQDSTHLNTFLPPPPEVIADSICAVFISKDKPSENNIKSLHPVLARKTRVKCILDFLIKNNPHYHRDAGFGGYSEENMSRLFANEDSTLDESYPCAMEIGHLPLNDAIEGSTGDYTHRNDFIEHSNAINVMHNSNESYDPDKLLMENVSYTTGDTSPESYNQMKMKALGHCLSGGSYIQSRAGSDLVSDFHNDRLLSMLFPHLDPWGIGGFHDRRRKKYISMEEQLSHLLISADSRFERDSTFAFVYYNVLQKKKAFDTVKFTVSESKHEAIIQELLNVNIKELQRLEYKIEKDSHYKPTSESENNIIKLLAKINLVGTKIPGTAGYKLVLRNEIRSLMNIYGTATLFLTINPSDINHPLVRLNSGENIDLEDIRRGEDLDSWKRRLLVAEHPAACALFFDQMITSFIDVILRYGRDESGIFGKCTAYYGTVEAQGKGTLHCHMLIWLQGHPSPQILRNKMTESTQYTEAVFTWLESIIKCELLGTETVINEPNGTPLEQPSRENHEPHPGTIPLPKINNFTPEQFEREYLEFVNSLVKEYNWHVHSATCWKYLQRGKERTDANCRMRMNGKTEALTRLDPETLSIILRRLHPRIASYNDLVIFLLQCNIDIKFIGSGEAAKALLYYVTDYITKPSLPMHIGLAALSYAITRTTNKFANADKNLSSYSQSALTTTINSMMGHQEVSHQQVMSYLVGGGDHYTSNTFQLLYWSAFDRLINRMLSNSQDNNEPSNTEIDQDISDSELEEDDNDDQSENDWIVDDSQDDADDDVDDDTSDQFHINSDENNQSEVTSLESVISNPENLEAQKEGSMILKMESGSILAYNQQYDYIFRSEASKYEQLCLYDFVSVTRKISIHNKDEIEQYDQGRFCSDIHPQYKTHVLQLRKKSTAIPVILGAKIPRPDRSESERELWARSILILFKPWRTAQCLKEQNETWFQAYERFEPTLENRQRRIIQNMNVMSECKDARDEYSNLHHSNDDDGELQNSRDALSEAFDDGSLLDSISSVFQPFSDANNLSENEVLDIKEPEPADIVMGKESANALDKCQKQGRNTITIHELELLDDSRKIDTNHIEDLKVHANIMETLKRKRRPDIPETESQPVKKKPRLQNPLKGIREPRINIGSLDLSTPDNNILPDIMDTSKSFETTVCDLIQEQNLSENQDQERAFRIIANHIENGDSPLLMYIGGVGGTGKSHVIQSIVKLFERLGKIKELMLSAPTGAAAVVINGHTIHALTMLHPGSSKKKDSSELRALWADVKYLVIDEISMVSAYLLSIISDRLREAKGEDPHASQLPFGGISIIFTGDFGQLTPVSSVPLFSHTLVSNPGFSESRDNTGIHKMTGAYLWRQVNTVVLLTKNQRQKDDPQYADFLNRLRVGECATHQHDALSDLELIRNRVINEIDRGEIEDLTEFQDAPIIVGSRKLQDAINVKMIKSHAQRLGKEVHTYVARDFRGKDQIADEDRKILLNLSSTVTKDSYGQLPLFVGMRVMITSNLAFTKKIVNGAQGTVEEILYSTEENGSRIVSVVRVRVPGSGKFAEDLAEDIVPIFPIRTSFQIKIMLHNKVCKRSVNRIQVPLAPGYCYTDYKSQGRSLEKVIVDIASARSLQGVYVMLSRVKSLKGLAVLRWFPQDKLYGRLSQDLRNEFARLEVLNETTLNKYNTMVLNKMLIN